VMPELSGGPTRSDNSSPRAANERVVFPRGDETRGSTDAGPHQLHGAHRGLRLLLPGDRPAPLADLGADRDLDPLRRAISRLSASCLLAREPFAALLARRAR